MSRQSNNSSVVWIVIGFFVIGLPAIGLLSNALQGPRESETTVTVTGHRWERTIYVEEFGSHTQRVWGHKTFVGAYDIRFERAQTGREHEDANCVPVRPTPDPVCEQLDCSSGGGGASGDDEVGAPASSYLCDRTTYTQDEWYRIDNVVAEGEDRNPQWSPLDLNECDESEADADPAFGCQRQSGQWEEYYVTLLDSEGGTHECELAYAQWTDTPLAATFTALLNNRNKSLRCDTLAAASAQ